jgi:Zn-dependent protease
MFGLLQLLLENPIVFVLVVLALVFSITIHEFAHAFVATKLGDSTAKNMGRVSLNPLAHLDPLGTLMLVFVGFGWGKPVPFNPYALKNPKVESALISVAGPVSNFILAVILAVIARFVPSDSIFFAFIYLTIFYNLILGIFNLLPLHPLDGFKVVYGILPQNLAWQWQQTEQYGIYVLILLVLTRSTGAIITPLVNFGLTLLGIS